MMKAGNFKRGLPLLWWISIAAISGAVTMLLWNWLVPSIFGLAAISYWQALGLLVLTRILFGGFGRKMMPGGMMHEGNPIRDKWMKMTPAERKEFIDRRREFMHGGPFGRRGSFRDEDMGFEAGNSEKGNE